MGDLRTVLLWFGLGFLKKRVDLVLTGINPTANVSRDITYSGTVTSALEATIWNMKGIAFSIDANEVNQIKSIFLLQKEIIIHVVQTYLKHELPPFTILNVNIPYLPLSQIRGYRLLAADPDIIGMNWFSCVDPFDALIIGLADCHPMVMRMKEQICGELSRGYVSITPIHLDLTAYEMMPSYSKMGMELARR
jgi:5'-nucleotidase